MQTKAKLRYLRMSPKKVRLVADLIRGMQVEKALDQLNFLNKAASQPLTKLVNSAVSNAVNNFELVKENLFIKEIRVDQGGILKRWKPRAHGRATPIRKRMSHVLLVLDEIDPTSAKKVKTNKEKVEKAVKVKSLDEAKTQGKPEPVVTANKDEKVDKETQEAKGQEIQDVRMEGKHRHQQNQDKKQVKGKKGFMKKIFNRKAG